MTRNSFKQQDRLTQIPFRHIQFLTSSTTPGYTSGALELLSSNLGVRAIAASKMFEFWRFQNLRISMRSATVATPSEVSGATATPAGVVFAVAYSPLPAGDQVVSLSFEDLAQLNCFSMKPTTQEAVITVPRATLQNIPYKWLRTTVTGTPPLDETSGGSAQYLIWTAVPLATGVTHWIVVEGVIELRGQISVDTSFSTPDLFLPSSSFTDDDDKESPVMIDSRVDILPDFPRKSDGQAVLRSRPGVFESRALDTRLVRSVSHASVPLLK